MEKSRKYGIYRRETGVHVVYSIGSLSYCEDIISAERNPLNNTARYFTKDGKTFLQIGSEYNLIMEENEEEIEVSTEEKVVIKEEDIKQLNKISDEIEKPKNVYKKLYFRKGVRQ
jgi:hypothetical protein